MRKCGWEFLLKGSEIVIAFNVYIVAISYRRNIVY